MVRSSAPGIYRATSGKKLNSSCDSGTSLTSSPRVVFYAHLMPSSAKNTRFAFKILWSDVINLRLKTHTQPLLFGNKTCLALRSQNKNRLIERLFFFLSPGSLVFLYQLLLVQLIFLPSRLGRGMLKGWRSWR